MIAPLRIGPIELDSPVVLAPMAGVTNPAFRLLCAEHGAGLLVSEMTSARGLVERNQRSMDMVRFHPAEQRRSVQLHAVEPDVGAEAVRMLIGDHGVDHIDLNFGCPVPKVTRKGGGSALPWRRRLFADIVEATVRAASAAGAVPVTVKMRLGIDDEHLTHLEAGRRAALAGAAAVGLHARTAADLYGPPARWDHIAELVTEIADVAPGVPVLGNGDIWTAADAVTMMARTGCAGVIVGRGCLGRPWLFRDLEAALGHGVPDGGIGLDRVPPVPRLASVTATMRRHAAMLVEWFGPDRGARDFRKHSPWYLQGFPVGGPARRRLGLVESLADVHTALDEIDERVGDVAPEPNAVDGKRGHTRGPQRVVVPQGWYERVDDPTPPVGADLAVSGG